jgi:hypothetical protein
MRCDFIRFAIFVKSLLYGVLGDQVEKGFRDVADHGIEQRVV